MPGGLYGGEGCQSGRVLAGTALLGAASWYAQHPPCTKWHTSSSILVIALVYGGAAFIVHANDWLGRVWNE